MPPKNIGRDYRDGGVVTNIGERQRERKIERKREATRDKISRNKDGSVWRQASGKEREVPEDPVLVLIHVFSDISRLFLPVRW